MQILNWFTRFEPAPGTVICSKSSEWKLFTGVYSTPGTFSILISSPLFTGIYTEPGTLDCLGFTYYLLLPLFLTRILVSTQPYSNCSPYLWLGWEHILYTASMQLYTYKLVTWAATKGQYPTIIQFFLVCPKNNIMQNKVDIKFSFLDNSTSYNFLIRLSSNRKTQKRGKLDFRCTYLLFPGWFKVERF